MPHSLTEIAGGNLKLASEVSDTLLTTTPLDLASCFEHVRLQGPFNPALPIAPGSPSGFQIAFGGGYVTTGWALIEEGPVKEMVCITGMVNIPPGNYIYTVSRIKFPYTPAAKLYGIGPVQWDKINVIDPNPACKELSTLSAQGPWRDQEVFRQVFLALTAAEWSAVYQEVAGGPPPPGTRDEQIWDLITNYFRAPGHTVGPGSYNPGSVLEDGGPQVSFALASFEDQFEEVSGAATFDEFIWEVPFDLLLTRASIYTNASTAADGYVTITKNDVVAVVAAGPVPPNRNLPAVTGVLKGLDLPNVPCVKGDKLTVRLNLPTLNTVKRAKVVLGYASRLSNL